MVPDAEGFPSWNALRIQFGDDGLLGDVGVDAPNDTAEKAVTGGRRRCFDGG